MKKTLTRAASAAAILLTAVAAPTIANAQSGALFQINNKLDALQNDTTDLANQIAGVQMTTDGLVTQVADLQAEKAVIAAGLEELLIRTDPANAPQVEFISVASNISTSSVNDTFISNPIIVPQGKILIVDYGSAQLRGIGDVSGEQAELAVRSQARTAPDGAALSAATLGGLRPSPLLGSANRRLSGGFPAKLYFGPGEVDLSVRVDDATRFDAAFFQIHGRLIDAPAN